MRHAGATLTLSIVLLATAMIHPAYVRGLVSAARRQELLLPHSLPTGRAAITLAPVTATTESKHRVATGVTTPARATAVNRTVRCHDAGSTLTTILHG
jgi:hypothetical protein